MVERGSSRKWLWQQMIREQILLNSRRRNDSNSLASNVLVNLCSREWFEGGCLFEGTLEHIPCHFEDTAWIVWVIMTSNTDISEHWIKYSIEREANRSPKLHVMWMMVSHSFILSCKGKDTLKSLLLFLLSSSSFFDRRIHAGKEDR